MKNVIILAMSAAIAVLIVLNVKERTATKMLLR